MERRGKYELYIWNTANRTYFVYIKNNGMKERKEKKNIFKRIKNQKCGKKIKNENEIEKNEIVKKV